MLFVLFVLIYIEIKGQGYGTYQSWKLISFFQPIILTLTLAVVAVGMRNANLIVGCMLGIALMSSIPIWGLSSTSVGFTNSDFEKLGSNRVVGNLKNLNIDLNPYFETMAVTAVINGPRLFIKSPSYWSSSFNQNACTLVRLENAEYTDVIPLNGTYGLAPSLKSDCGVQRQPMEIYMDQVLWTNSENPEYLGRGWSSPEQWGTWSVSSSPQIMLQLKNWEQKDAYLKIDSQAFLYKNHNELLSQISVNGEILKEITFNTLSNNQFIQIRIPFDLLMKNRGQVLIDFELNTITSPKNLGLSNDTRNLGIGVKSLLITQK
jgi:hypothetical protein